MLDEFKEVQTIAYSVIKNSILNDKISHAYLIENNNYSDYIPFTKAFVKALLCPKKNTKYSNCGQCMQCQKINHDSFPEIKEIKPEGLWIKKEQLQQLQQEFSTKPVESKYKIYIIHDAERLNQSSANSILKFLEEPESNIIAILLTNNIYGMLSTIVSRCQIIKLKPNFLQNNFDNIITALIKNGETIENFKNDEVKISLIGRAIEFIIEYEKSKKNVLLYMQTLWHDFFNDKEKIILGFNIIILFYKEILNYKLLNEVKYFENYSDSIKIISSENSVDEISRKLQIIIDLNEKVYYNINNQLLMDKLILRLEGE